MTDDERAHYRRRIRELEVLKHRGSGTDHERRAADYLVGELKSLGLDADVEPFPGGRSWAWRHLLHVVVAALVSFRVEGMTSRILDAADAVDYDAAYAGVEFAWALLRRLAQESETNQDLELS
jgi:hypothetical protein